jgi:hypothetical protein
MAASSPTFGLERVVPADQARAREGHDPVDVEDGGLLAAALQLDRLVVGKPGRGVDGAGLHGHALAEIGVLDDDHIVGRQLNRAEERLEHHPR